MIPVFEPVLGETDVQNVMRSVESGWISSGGNFVKEFEQGMATLCGRRFGLAVNSGTSSLITNFKALNLPEGGGHHDLLVRLGGHLQSPYPGLCRLRSCDL